MLTEEALILVFTLGACVLVVLGTLELIAPSRPRHPRLRRPVPPAPSVPLPMSAAVPGPAVARCAELLEGMHYAEVIAEATAALAPSVSAAALLSNADAAALWSMVGRSRHAVGDDEGARAALESALALAPAGARTEHEGHLVALALRVAQARLDRAVGEVPCEPEERVAAILDALAWLDRGIALGRGDSALVELAYLRPNANVKSGQPVVTSGNGGIFPKEIPIGKIVDARPADYGLSTEARVKLAANLNALEEVWVLFEP